MSIKLVIGLGNSGVEYARTRHNTGVIALGELAIRLSENEGGNAHFLYNKYCAANIANMQIAGKPIFLAHTNGYMNVSGQNLRNILKFLKLDISETAVIYDDISLDIARLKISQGGSSGGHNGVADIMACCGNSFVRLRIGIGSKLDKRMDLADYVLGKLSDDDIAKIKAIDLLGCIKIMVSKGVDAAQNIYNRTSEPKVKQNKMQLDKPEKSVNEI